MSSGDEVGPAVGYPMGGGKMSERLGRGVVPLSTVGRLHIKRTDLQRELNMIDEALEALKANPEVEKILHLVSRVGM